MADQPHKTHYPSQRLAALIAEGALQPDAAQASIAAVLDTLVDEVAKAASPSLIDFIKSMLHRRSAFASIKGLYIYGGVGRGKTMLMDMFYQGVMMRMPGTPASPTVWRLHFHDFMVLVQDVIHSVRGTGADDPIEVAAANIAARGRVICFDEMEVRDIADAMILARLFSGIMARGVVVVATSNRHVDDLYKGGLHRDRFLPFIDLLKDRCAIFRLDDGMDWRGAVLAEMRSWHVPINTASAAALASAFDRLAGDVTVTCDVVRVAGREIVFDKVAGDVGYVSFNSLCDVPLAARDYLAIAGRFSGLIISHIPSFTITNENAARRFMWLIDALYDRNRFLIASAEAEIDRLYAGDHWHFEFSRTASRLNEMTQRGRIGWQV